MSKKKFSAVKATEITQQLLNPIKEQNIQDIDFARAYHTLVKAYIRCKSENQLLSIQEQQ